MMWRWLGVLFLAPLSLPGALVAGPWQFDAPVPVTASAGDKVFHHMESSGRRNIAISGNTVAVAWEDDRDGTPRIYLARKELAGSAFASEIRVSGEGEAFEPSLAALGAGRFAVAWEEDGRVRARTVSGDGLGPVFDMPAQDAAQASLAVHDGDLLLVDAERKSSRFSRIMLHRLAVQASGALKQTLVCAVDGEAPADEQLYPAAAVQGGRLIVAWEDRRPGHTVIMAAESPADQACAFRPPERISLRRTGGGRTMPYGRGHGVARVALAAHGQSGVLAAWADKRDFREGYDIYCAPWEPGQGFGANARVQDAFGGLARQWHPAVAGDAAGQLVVAWDDDRDGDANVMLSWREGGGWSEDMALPGADGPGQETHPAITIDSGGNLHVAWVARETVDGPTRLFYVTGRRGGEARPRQ